MAMFNIGKEEKKSSVAKYDDAERAIANKGYFLEFMHIPTGKVVQFKAMLTGLSDRYNSNWSESEYYGRMDPIAIFKNTKRSISVAWSLVAASEEESISNMKKLSLLVSMLYPVYNESDLATSMSSSPLFKLTFANLITNSDVQSNSSNASTSGLVGRMSGLEVTPNLEAGFFDVSVGKLYPKEYSLSFSYTVFHTHTVGWKRGSNDFWTSKFPYGEQHFGDPDIKKIKNDSQNNKTTQQKQAAVNKITKNKGRK